MHDLLQTAAQCRAQLEELGIDCSAVRCVEPDKRARRTWGTCRKFPDGSCRIGVSTKLLADEVPTEALKDTIYHEFLHAATGCTGHRGAWKELAAFVNGRLGTTIGRTATWAQKGLDQSEDPTIRYRFACRGCGQEVVRFRACRFTKYYKRYVCARCGGKFQKL
jgi:predicted SprT family Zn-dependent metalloprotease